MYNCCQRSEISHFRCSKFYLFFIFFCRIHGLHPCHYTLYHWIVPCHLSCHCLLSRLNFCLLAVKDTTIRVKHPCLILDSNPGPLVRESLHQNHYTRRMILPLFHRFVKDKPQRIKKYSRASKMIDLIQ